MAKLFAAQLSSTFSQTSSLDRTVFVKEFIVDLTGPKGTLSTLTLTSTPKLKLDIDALDLPLVSNSSYSIVVNSGVVSDTTYPGFTSVPQTINYTTDAGPSLSTVYSNPSKGDKLFLKFNYQVKASSLENIYLYKAGTTDTLIKTYKTSTGGGSYGPQPTIVDKLVTLNTAGMMVENASYYLLLGAGALQDKINSANSFAVTDKTKFAISTDTTSFNGLSSTLLVNSVLTAEPYSAFVLSVTTTAVNQVLSFSVSYTDNTSLVVKWGDGISATFNDSSDIIESNFVTTPIPETQRSLSHTFAAIGTYQVTIDGPLTKITCGSNAIVREIKTFNAELRAAYFTSLSNLTAVPASLPTSLRHIRFTGCSKLNASNISNWNTSNLVNMDSMFASCNVFNQPLNNWDTSKVESMREMFNRAFAFNQPLNNWDTSKVKAIVTNNNIIGESMHYMFEEAISFNQDISSWDVSTILSAPFHFSYASGLNGPMQAGWTTARKPQWGTTGSH